MGLNAEKELQLEHHVLLYCSVLLLCRFPDWPVLVHFICNGSLAVYLFTAATNQFIANFLALGFSETIFSIGKTCVRQIIVQLY